jgi:hypothetical protein
VGSSSESKSECGVMSEFEDELAFDVLACTVQGTSDCACRTWKIIEKNEERRSPC